MYENEFETLPDRLQTSIKRAYYEAVENGMYSQCAEDSCYYSGQIDILRNLFGTNTFNEIDEMI